MKMKNQNILLISVAIFLVVASHQTLGLTNDNNSEDDDNSDTSANTYESNDYNYDSNNADGDYVEEPQPSLLPSFTTEAQHFKVAKGRLIRLPCRVDRLGPTIISWKKSDASGTNYHFLATGSHLHANDDRISLTDVNDHGSTLLIQMANETDAGEYVCSVSSNPPATLRHHVSLIVPPTVEILKPEGSNTYRLRSGEELALVCHGHGDPLPTLTWKREKKRMPDGRNSIAGNEVIFKNATRKHSGTYICEGSNGSGQIVNDSITVDVLHSPEIVPEQSYIQQKEGVQLELVCIVHASPVPFVHWYRDGSRLTDDQMDRIRIGHIGRKHILTVSSISADRDSGMYTCHAINDIGEAKENFQILTASETVVRDTLQRTGKQDKFQSEILPETQAEMADERTSSSMESSMNDWSSGQATLTSTSTLLLISILTTVCRFLSH